MLCYEAPAAENGRRAVPLAGAETETLMNDMPCLLSIDLGVRTGFALYGHDSRLRWFRSQNFGSRNRLKRYAFTLLKDTPELEWLILEGGGDLECIWRHEARRRNVQTLTISAETWRQELFYPRQQKNGELAKNNALDLALKVIDWCGLPRPASLRHDAAEAILVGLWSLKNIGWVENFPDFLRR